MATCDTVATEDKSVDWAELRALHVKGVSLSDLSKRFGISYSAIRNKSSRERWRDTVAKARDHVTQGATDELSTNIRSWVGKLDQWGHKVIDSIIKRDPDDMSEKRLQEMTSAVKSLAEVVRTNYGLDKQTESKPASLTVNVAITGGHATGQALHLGQVIDADVVSDVAKQVGDGK